jgi:replication-associated recombination protein RarA
MVEMWINKYKPKSINDYVGDQYQMILYYIDEFYKGKKNKGFIIYGKPGVGKSALIDVIRDYYNADMYIINTSDDRNNLDFNAMNAPPLTGDKKIIILEEIDGFNPKEFKVLSKIIELSKHPIILICNEIKLIDNIVISKCYIKEITCNKFTLKNLANKIIKTESLNINKDQLNKALISIKSYRSLFNYLQYNYISEMGSFKTNGNFKDEIIFTNDNSESPKLISLSDIFFKRSQEGYKNGQKISKYIIDSIDVKKSDYPRTYKLIHEVKNKKVNTGTIKIIGFK